MIKRKKSDAPAEEVPLDSKLSRDEINALHIRAYQGPVEVIRSHKHMLSTVRKLRKERLLGFDTETRRAFKKGISYPTAVVQLAAHDCVYIFQLQLLRDLGELFSILASGKIIKAGVSIADDMKALRTLSDFEPAGLVDIGDCARTCGMQHHGLRGLAALLLKFRITKSGQRYNWALPTLRQPAIRYAATDAWVGRKLYLVMKKRGCI